MMKAKFLCIFLLIGLVGCKGRADTEPQAIFTQIKDDIVASTGRDIYWNGENDIIDEVTLDDLLKDELTVDKAVEIALLNNPTLQAEYERIGIASANYRQAGLLQNPFFMFNYQFAAPATTTDQMNLDLIQNFLEIFLIPLKKRVAEQEIVILKNEILGTIIDVISRTKIAFHDLQVSRSIFELREKIAYSKGLSYEAAILLRCAGNTTELNLAYKKMEYERAKLAVTAALTSMINAKEDVNDLLGVWGKDVAWTYTDQREPFANTHSDTANIERDSIQNNLELKNLFERLKQRADQLSIDTTYLVFPDISFGYSSNYQEHVWFIGPQVSINIPMFDIGKVYSLKAKAEIAYLWKQFTAEAVRIRSVVRRATDHYFNSHHERVHVEDKILPITKKVFEETLLQHNAMQLGVFEVLEAKEAVFEREIVWLEKESEFYTNKVFIQALGRGFVLSENLQ